MVSRTLLGIKRKKDKKVNFNPEGETEKRGDLQWKELQLRLEIGDIH